MSNPVLCLYGAILAVLRGSWSKKQALGYIKNSTPYNAFDESLWDLPKTTPVHDCSEAPSPHSSPEWWRLPLGKKRDGHSRRLPTGAQLKEIVRRIFVEQCHYVLGRLKHVLEEVVLKKKPGKIKDDKWTDLSGFNKKMADKSTPALQVWYDESAKDAQKRLNLKDETREALEPRIREAVKKAAFKFSKDTNDTTSLQLRTALKKLREEIAAGVINGENTAELTKRVRGVFDQAENFRAERIARTESVRAVHAAQVMVAKESGLVKGFKWLCSAGACPICKAIAAENPDGVNIGENFSEDDYDESGYGKVEYPPAHPNCMCTIEEILVSK